ncbi:MAG: 16S rRNA (cytidine(1402)-2'-O)-methyltransferase [Pseudomonadales bacterium]
MSQPATPAQRIEAAVYVVSTPIGNLGDITARALELLAAVDLIAAEDTRHSAGLLAHFGIATPMQAYHDHSDGQAAQRLLDRIEAGEAVALISDAGTPLIADPGYRLVRSARERGLAVVPVPGASAMLAAIAVAGMPTDRFAFEGFLPSRAGARHKLLESLYGETRTLVFYEAPHRIEETLAAMQQVFGGQREALLARELTKQFETLISDTLEGLLQRVREDANQRRGEIVLVVAGAPKDDTEAIDQQLAHTLRVLLKTLPLKQAVALAVEITGASRNRAYDMALAQRQHEQGE